jgi:membrane glycosyltransferase
MSADAVLRLVRAMQADPTIGIVQQLIVGRPATSAFPRLFQFGMRAGMRTWATGQAWWQGPDGPYWGHNALIRIAAFRAHCKLEHLPNGEAILSHDQVEAVRMRAAGFKVFCLPAEAGSLEGNPPAMPEFLKRDLRWLTGNLQYRWLLNLPGMTAMGRWQLLQAILLFAGAPLYVLMLVLAALNGATGGGAGFPVLSALVFTLAWVLALYAPKLLGYTEVLLDGAKASSYGGRARFLRGAAAEFAFTLLLDAVSNANKAIFMAGLPFGARMGWAPQNRADRGVTWEEAARMLWPHTLLGVVVFILFALTSWWAVLWALPFAGGLLVAIPLCVVTSDPGFSARLRQARIAATPEELAAA